MYWDCNVDTWSSLSNILLLPRTSSSMASASSKKRVRVEFSEDTAIAEVAETVNLSAKMAANRLVVMQGESDEAAKVAARRQRVAASAKVFEGDAGLSDGLLKMKEQIVLLKHRLGEMEAAAAAPLPMGEVLFGGKSMTSDALELRRAATSEELSRLEMAVSALASRGSSMLRLIRQLATDGDIRGEVVPARGARPRGMLSAEAIEDVIVHHYIGPSLPLHLCMAADLAHLEDLAETRDDEGLDESMCA